MIHNVPTAEDLETISLRLYFNAWASVASIVAEFNDVIGLPEEWDTYAEAAQNDLQGIYTLALQSQEIGIKSLIARVSPYLLLKRYDARPMVPATNDFDFSDFPTIEAGELVRAHNMFCSVALSQGFADDFERLRRGRNKIAHLGVFHEKLDPHDLIDLLFKHYAALYPARRWLPDRLTFVSSDRWAGFDSGSDWSPRGAVLTELWDIQADLTPEQLEIIFGRPSDEQRYVCPSCAQVLEKHTWGSEPYGADTPTAFLDSAEKLNCALCSETFALRKHRCNDEDCAGRHLAGAPEHDERCIACGHTQD